MIRPARSLLATSAIVAGACLIASCAQTPSGADRLVIRVGYSGVLDFDDVPSAIAHDLMRRQGYPVEEVVFSTTEQAIEALARGRIEFANGALRSAWAARAKGADVVTLMTHVGNVHGLVTVPAIARCADLDGRTVGIDREGAGGTAFLRAYIAEACPGITVRTVSVPQSVNRSAALVSGGLDAAVVELNQWAWIESQAPGRFQVLERFGRRWPDIATSGVHVNRTFATSFAGHMRAYIAARLEANRLALEDRARLVAEANRIAGPSPYWPPTAALYVEEGFWAVDGGLTRESAARSLAFLSARQQVAWTLTVDDVVDLSWLDESPRGHSTSNHQARR